MKLFQNRYYCLSVVLSLLFIFSSAVEAKRASTVFTAAITEVNKFTLKYSGDKPKYKTFIFPIATSNGIEHRYVIDFFSSEITPQFQNTRKDKDLESVKFRIGQFNKTTVRLVVPSLSLDMLQDIQTDNVTSGAFILSFDLDHFQTLTSGESIPTVPEGTNSIKSDPDQLPIKSKQEKTLKAIELPTKDEKASGQIYKSPYLEGNPPNVSDHLLRSSYISLVKKSNDKVVFSLDSPQAIDHHIVLLEDPYRLVIDIENWPLNKADLAITNFQKISFVNDIRIGKPFKKKKTIRIVLDLKHKVFYEESLKLGNKSLYVDLSMKPTDQQKKQEKVIKQLSLSSINLSGYKILLDAGHGGYDAGAVHSNVLEKDLTLSMTAQTAAILRGLGATVYETRKSDEYISLDDRVQATLRIKPDIFISIHCNALHSNTSIKGIETYFYTQKSKNLAFTLHNQLLFDTKAADRKVRRARFVVIRKTDIPSVLLETGFMSNSAERNLLQTSRYQKILSESIAKGIASYLLNK